MSVNGTLMQYFHWYYGNQTTDSKLWVKVKNDAPDLSELGITALWLPPPYKGCGGENDVGYGIYDLYDLGEFNQKGSIGTKYGTRQQYLDAIETAHKCQIDIYADIVFNHKAGADNTQWVKASKVAYEDHNFVIKDNLWIEAWTEFNFSERNNAYSKFKWNYSHFDGVDWAQNLQEQSIFKFEGLGKDWAKMVSGEKGNYDYLMFSDIDMNHPEVRTELARWARWFLQTSNVDGFRIDAVKHIQYSFFRDWLYFIRREFPHKNLFAVGEFWSSEINNLKHYIDMTEGCMSLFDAPLQKNFFDASRTPFGGYDMRKILDGTLVREMPYLAVTICDNHDTQPCQALERWVEWWFKPLAYAIMLLRAEGYPCVFYPDLYGASYTDKGYDINLMPVPKLSEMIKARKNFAYGPQRDYFDHPNAIGWTREGDKEHKKSGVAVLLSNSNASNKWMEIGKQHAGKTFVDFLSNIKTEVQINQDGWGEFLVSSGSVSVWVEK